MRPDVRPLRVFSVAKASSSTSSDERGNRILIIICLVNLLILYPGTKAYYIWRNRQRARIWDAMTPEAGPWTVTEKDDTDVASFTGESALSGHYKGRWE